MCISSNFSNEPKYCYDSCSCVCGAHSALGMIEGAVAVEPSMRIQSGK